MIKCQRCPKVATFHITEIVAEDRIEDVHLCEDCFKKAGPIDTASPKAAIPSADAESEDIAEIATKHCEACGIKFVEFRNSGRLGCPHDYDSFRVELVPLLESIHGDTKHAGKRPQRLPKAHGAASELANLRRQLQTAITKEDYEAAAQLRDAIRQLEEPALASSSS
jgi:protein arginine kinase activator